MDSPELYEEIGRMKQRVDRQRAEIAVLKEKTRVLDQANMAMHEALAIANHQLETERAEKASMEKDVRARMEGMEEEIRILTEQLSKAQRTIKVQSDQIAAPTREKSHWTSPSRAGPSRQLVEYSRPPPPFNLPTATSPAPYPARYGGQMGSFPTATTQYPALPYHPPPQQRQYRALEAPPLRQQERQFMAPSSTLITIRREEGEISLSNDLAALFQRSENWGRQFCSIPDPARDALIPPYLCGRMASVTNPHDATALLSQIATRPLFVAKVINHELTLNCLRASLINGFDAATDSALATIRARHKPGITTPLNIQREMRTAAASTIVNAVSNPRFESWVQRQVEESTTKLWGKLGGLCAEGTRSAEARGALREIWSEVYRVGVQMAVRVRTFSTEYPAVGGPFEVDSMVCRDEWTAGIEAAELKTRGPSVRLAITPVVIEGMFERDGVVRRVLCQAECLLSFL